MGSQACICEMQFGMPGYALKAIRCKGGHAMHGEDCLQKPEIAVDSRAENTGVARERAERLLDRVGLAHKADFYPSQISGG